MRASVLVDVGKMEVREVPRPVAGPSDLLLEVSAVGVCGTDFHIFSGESNYNLDERGDPLPLREAPQILGHEVAATVVEVGREARGIRAGDRVVIDQGLSCAPQGRAPLCEYCASGASHQCEHYREFGITGLPGGFAQFMAVPAVSAVKTRADLDPAEAAMAEPLACVLHSSATVARATARYAIGASDPARRVRAVLLCGAGPAGLLFVQVLRRVYGFDGPLLVSEVNAKKRALAEHYGAESIDPRAADLVEVVRERTGGRMVEFLIEATGSGAVFAAIPALVRKQATVLKYGIGYGGQSLEVINRLHWKEPTLLMPVGASGPFDSRSGPQVYRDALGLIEERTIDVRSLLSHRYQGLERVPAAFGGEHTHPEYVKGVAIL